MLLLNQAGWQGRGIRGPPHSKVIKNSKGKRSCYRLFRTATAARPIMARAVNAMKSGTSAVALSAVLFANAPTFISAGAAAASSVTNAPILVPLAAKRSFSPQRYFIRCIQINFTFSHTVSS